LCMFIFELSALASDASGLAYLGIMPPLCVAVVGLAFFVIGRVRRPWPEENPAPMLYAIAMCLALSAYSALLLIYIMCLGYSS